MDYSEAAMMVWKRKPEFVEGYRMAGFVGGYNPIDDFTFIIKKVFGDYHKNKKEGLVKQYKILKDLVVKNNIIGLVLLGKNVDEFITEYITYNNNCIELTVSTICTMLLSDYFTEDEIKEACYKTPNIENYLDK